MEEGRWNAGRLKNVAQASPVDVAPPRRSHCTRTTTLCFVLCSTPGKSVGRVGVLLKIAAVGCTSIWLERCGTDDGDNATGSMAQSGVAPRQSKRKPVVDGKACPKLKSCLIELGSTDEPLRQIAGLAGDSSGVLRRRYTMRRFAEPTRLLHAIAVDTLKSNIAPLVLEGGSLPSQ